ncbi:MAG: STAS domain-containing protein [Planctomycetes bacterium]|nr:STAS domain-containing protein [Planctomycetota bacterium]
MEREVKLSVNLRHQDGGVVCVDMVGFVDRHTIKGLEDSIRQLLDEGHRRIVINFDKLQYISSDGISLFISYLIKIRKEKGDIKFCNLKAEGKTVLSVLGLQNLFQNFASEPEAIEAFDKVERVKSMKKLEVTWRRPVEDVCVVELNGFIDKHTINVLDEAIEKITKEGTHRLVINCDQLTYISSNGIGVFIFYLPKVRKQKGDIKFCNLQNQGRTLLTVLGLHNMFETFDTEEKAVAAFSGN